MRAILKNINSKCFYICIGVIFLMLNQKTNAQLIYIPDPGFRTFLQANYPSAMIGDSLNPNDGTVYNAQSLYLSGIPINDLTGIEAFLNLNTLEAAGCGLSIIPDLPNALWVLNLSHNNIQTLNGLAPYIDEIDFSYNSLAILPANISCAALNISYNNFSLLPSPLGCEQLYCSYNNLTSLPANLSSMITVNCSHNNISTLPPASDTDLESLDCSYNSISFIPNYSQLTELNISGLPVTVLSSLDSVYGILTMDSMIPKLTSIPVIVTHNIQELSINNNNLNSLKGLSAIAPNLTQLNVSSNNLLTLDSLPNSLTHINCSNNLIQSLPNYLPPDLIYLNCKNNPVTCIPSLPNTLNYFEGDANDCAFNIPTSCISCGINQCSPTYTCNSLSYVTGTVFSDANSNGTFDIGENKIPAINVFASNGNFATSSNLSGVYYLPSDTGIAFTASVMIPPYRTLTTSSSTHSFAYYGAIDSLENIGLFDQPNMNDLSITINTNEIRPGFNYLYYVTVRNKGTTVQNGICYFVKSAGISFVSANPTPDSFSGDTIFWNFSGLLPLATTKIELELNTPAAIPLGTILVHTAGVVGSAAELTNDDNTALQNVIVIGSFDPNEKVAEPTNYFTTTQLANGDYIYYTVRFQNTGTASAINVFVSDQLSQNLNLSSFEMMNASHLNSWKIENGLLQVRFDNINLVDSNSNEVLSHGLFQYRIKPLATLTTGTAILNTANIYFDFNSPIVTNTTSNVITLPSAINGIINEDLISVFPTPAHDYLEVNLKANLNVAYKIFNLQSQLVKSGLLNENRIDIRNIKPGIYFLELKSDDKENFLKIVKN